MSKVAAGGTSAPVRGVSGQGVNLRQLALAIAIGLLLYLGLYAFIELLAYRYGEDNSFYKVATHDGTSATLVLGASHALPFEYLDMNQRMEEAVAGRVINLAITGGGVVPNQLLLDYYMSKHGPESIRTVVYFIDSFAFYSAEWNEDRLSDERLWQRAPLDPSLVSSLWRSIREHGVEPTVGLYYLTGFSKINDPSTWFTPDVWEAEADFENSYEASDFRDRQRLEYLYPESIDAATFERYLTGFDEMVEKLVANEIPLLVVKAPLREEFRSRLPDEAEFDERIRSLLDSHGVPLHDFSTLDFDESYYFDPDHLNRVGSLRFLDEYLKPVLDDHFQDLAE